MQYEKSSSINSENRGLAYGFLGVACFSLTLPATRIAVIELDSMLVGLGRGVVAGVMAIALLYLTHQPLPAKRHWPGIAVVALGVVLGFPLLSTWAMQQLPAAHGAVVLGILPLMTAIAGVFRAGDRPSLSFWAAGLVGSATVVAFGLAEGAGHLQLADLALLAAVIAAALGYAEGGRLAQILGSWQIICWALVFAAPFELLPLIKTVAVHSPIGSGVAWLGFAYVCLVSQFLGFFAWYHGLALSGVARVGQIQLLQPFLTLLVSAFLMGETVTGPMIMAACLVVGSVVLGKRAPIRRALG